MQHVKIGELRRAFCLNGTWKLEVDGESGLYDVRVPGSFSGQYQLWGGEHWNTWDYPERWFNKAAVVRRTIFVPGALAGRRVLIRFNGVRHMVRVSVNGREAGVWSDSYVPFSFDITDLVTPGENHLAVHIGAEATCGLYEDCNSNRRGIYRDTFLQIVPELRVDNDVHLRTLLRARRLHYILPLRNDSAAVRHVKLRFSVTNPDGETVLQWAEEQVHTLQPMENRTVEVSKDWNNPHLWSIDDPYLHHIHTEVLDAGTGTVLDRHALRFGFREITWANAKLYLNGEELYLRGNGDHPLGDMEGGKPFAEAMIRKLKSLGVQCMRMHNLPRHQELYEAGDELGFMYFAEASHHFRLPEPEVGKAHMARLVKYLRNHPCVLAWSVSNELHWRKIEEPKYLIDVCRENDPTRPAFASDFTPWSLHGDVVSHHYLSETIWSDWLEHGKDKAMIWDECGEVWQHDRNLDTGPAGYEIYGQDVATGLYRDGMEMIRNLNNFSDGKVVDGEFRRVTCYVPWEFVYNFFRFLPFNNMNKMYQRYDSLDQPGGIRIDYVPPCGNTTNIWDPTLPAFHPNPALYCFKDYLECVRCPDDPKEFTWFGGETMEIRGRLFYETHTPADTVSFIVESPHGVALTQSAHPVSLRPGEYVADFVTRWQLPKVDTATPVRLVRLFSRGGVVVHRQQRTIKLFPRRRVSELLPSDAAVVGDKLRAFFGGVGAELASATIIITDKMDDRLLARMREGVRVLRINTAAAPEFPPQTAKVDLDMPMDEVGREYVYKLPYALPLDPEGWFKISNWQTTKLHGVKDPESPWWEERNLWSSRPEAYQPHFRIILKNSDGETLTSSDETPLVLRRVQQCPADSEQKFLFSEFKWHRDGVPYAVDRLGSVSEIVLVQTKLYGPEVVGRLRGIQLFGYTKPGAMFPTNGAPVRFLAGLGDEDLARWRGEYVTGTLRLPAGRPVKRFLLGTKNGRGSSLHEWFMGKGMALETSLNLIESFATEPAAGEFLARCLERVSTFKPVTNTAAVAVIGDEALCAYVTSLGVDAEKLDNPQDLTGRCLVIAGASTHQDAKRLNAWTSMLTRYVSDGGTVHFSPVTEQTLAVVKAITHCDELALTEPFFHANTNCIKAPVSWLREGTPETLVNYFEGIVLPYPFEPNLSPLLSGIANIDLNWGGQTMFEQGIELKGMDPVMSVPGHNMLISNWHICSEPGMDLYGEMLNGARDLRQNAWFINRDAVVLQLNQGRGSFILNQLVLQAGDETSSRLMTQLLTNLGAPIAGARAPVGATEHDLTLQAEQHARFARYAKQIEPGSRQYYGIPTPMPAYLKETRIGADWHESLPVIGFVGDDLSLQLAHTLGEYMSDVLVEGAQVKIESMCDAVDAFVRQAGSASWDRVVLSVGNAAAREERLSPDQFAQQLAGLYAEVKKRAKQIFWLPPAPRLASDTEQNALVTAYARGAEKVFAGEEVYMVPFVFDNAEVVLFDFLRGNGKAFQLQEVRDLSKSLEQAVRSFGAM
jgi:hypothetical protein